ncbi:hypothetical protein FHQ18_11535 [Deferribacter autotrophicus]|uniref:DDE-type integrase/transposase/recombinase n=1 Tax=Deferribacter autotrophicus TaxID=500465 RepID=A0A5A8F1P8_9BACT|nr:Mu transposase C-terminal domain-containing protein [Deferribacter autotrophicus]KAA0257189.1 hypothetical protein FHQ18_11535 [Deferribacter autotrophicus]
MKLTAKEIAEILGVSRVAIIKRAKKENWLYVEEANPNGGKPIKYFIAESLPDEIRTKLVGNVTAQCNHNVTECNHNVTTQLSEDKEENKAEKINNVTLNVTCEIGSHLENTDNKSKIEKGSLVTPRLRNQNWGYKGTKEPKNCPTKELPKDEIWISISEASNLIGISERGVRKSCDKGKYKFIYTPSNKGRGGKTYKVALSSLPAEAQVKWVLDNNEKAKGLDAAITDKLSPMAILEIEKMKNVISVGSTKLNDKEKEELGLILKMIDEAKRAPIGISKRKHIENVARKYKKGRSTLERYIKIFNNSGIAGLKKLVSRKREKSLYAWDVEAIEFLKGVYLRGIRAGNKISKEKAYDAVVAEAKKRGWKVGSVSSAYQYLNDINHLLIKYAKGGRQALDNFFYIARDYSDLEPFQIVVGDQHQFDFWVRDIETDEIFRPMGYFFVDARTRLVYGFALSGRKYSSYTIGLALRMGLVTFGFFKSIYTDNGKPEISKYISSITKDITSFGAESKDFAELYKTNDGHWVIEDENGEIIAAATDVEDYRRKARAYNAKAKLIERFFRTFEDLLVYLGVPGRVVNKNDSSENRRESEKRLAEQIDKENVLTYEEFALRVFDAVKIYNNRKHESLKKSPLEQLAYCIKHEGFTVVLPESIEEIDKVFFVRAKRKVHRGRVQINNILYEANAELRDGDLTAGLWHLPDKTEVEIRYNPFDASIAYAILPDGSERELKPITYGSMIDKELTKSLIERKRSLMSAVTEKYKEYIKGVPEVLKYSKIKTVKKKSKKAQDSCENLTNEEILKRIKEHKEESNKVKPIKLMRSKIITSSVDKYEDILIRELMGEFLSSADLDFKRRYEAQLSDEEKKYWEAWRKIHGAKSSYGGV